MLSASGGRSSAPGPRWGLCPQNPIIGLCSALAMVPPTTDPFRRLWLSNWTLPRYLKPKVGAYGCMYVWYVLLNSTYLLTYLLNQQHKWRTACKHCFTTCNTILLVSRLKFIDIFEDACSIHTCFSADSFHLLCCITPCESSGRFFRATRYLVV